MLNDEVMPSHRDSGVDMVFQNVPQPWHPQSSYMHEVSLAVKIVDESKFFSACSAIFAAQENFFDDKTADKTRNQIYDALVEVVAVVGVVRPLAMGVRRLFALRRSKACASSPPAVAVTVLRLPLVPPPSAARAQGPGGSARPAQPHGPGQRGQRRDPGHQVVRQVSPRAQRSRDTNRASQRYRGAGREQRLERGAVGSEDWGRSRDRHGLALPVQFTVSNTLTPCYSRPCSQALTLLF